MFLKRRLGVLAPIIAALAIGASVPLASAATVPDPKPVVTGPSCPDGYAGPTNLATGCPYWLMSYTVQYPGQPSFRCPMNLGPSVATPDGVGGSDGRVLGGCAGLVTAD
jgi:hypothetical protein